MEYIVLSAEDGSGAGDSAVRLFRILRKWLLTRSAMSGRNWKGGRVFNVNGYSVEESVFALLRMS